MKHCCSCFKHYITPVCVDICPPIISVDKKQSQRKKASSRVSLFRLSHLFILVYIKEKQNRFVESTDSDIKKFVTNSVRESAKKSTKYAIKVFEGDEVLSKLSDLVLRKLRLRHYKE